MINHPIIVSGPNVRRIGLRRQLEALAAATSATHKLTDGAQTAAQQFKILSLDLSNMRDRMDLVLDGRKDPKAHVPFYAALPARKARRK